MAAAAEGSVTSTPKPGPGPPCPTASVKLERGWAQAPQPLAGQEFLAPLLSHGAISRWVDEATGREAGSGGGATLSEQNPATSPCSGRRSPRDPEIVPVGSLHPLPLAGGYHCPVLQMGKPRPQMGCSLPTAAYQLGASRAAVGRVTVSSLERVSGEDGAQSGTGSLLSGTSVLPQVLSGKACDVSSVLLH